jgi:photosystem II stability/assembly factor-like uncharacterized protein
MRAVARLGWAIAVAALLVPAGTASAQSSLWTEVPSGTPHKITAVEYQSDDRLWYATEKGEIVRRMGGVPQQQELVPATSVPFNDIAFQPGGDVGIAVGNTGTAYRTVNGGTTWLRLSGLQTLDHDCKSGQDTSEPVSGDLLSVTWADASTVYISGRERVVLRSTDAGLNFAERNKYPDRRCRTFGLEQDITDTAFAGAVGYLVSDGDRPSQIWRTADALATDTPGRARAVECGTRPRLALDPADLDRLWAVDQCSKNEAFRYSEDGGASFATVAVPGAPINALSDVAVAPGTLIAVGDGGEILISRDGRTASRHLASNHYWRAVDLADGARGAIGGDDGRLLVTTSADSVPVPPGATPPGGPFPAPSPPGAPPQGGTPPVGPSQGGTQGSGSSQGSGQTGAGSGGAVLGTRRARPALTLRIRSMRLSGGALRLRVGGRLVVPPGVDRTAACRGRVRLIFKTRGGMTSRRRVAVRPSCRFGTRIVAPAGGRLANATRIRVGARFGGNRMLEPARKAASRRVG